MPAYVIVEVKINDVEQYEEYQKLTPASIAAYGGKFMVRGAPFETLEGNWHPERIVVLQFESVSRAKDWWASDQYGVAKRIRQAAAQTKMIVIESNDQ